MLLNLLLRPTEWKNGIGKLWEFKEVLLLQRTKMNGITPPQTTLCIWHTNMPISLSGADYIHGRQQNFQVYRKLHFYKFILKCIPQHFITKKLLILIWELLYSL